MRAHVLIHVLARMWHHHSLRCRLVHCCHGDVFLLHVWICVDCLWRGDCLFLGGRWPLLLPILLHLASGNAVCQFQWVPDLEKHFIMLTAVDCQGKYLPIASLCSRLYRKRHLWCWSLLWFTGICCVLVCPAVPSRTCADPDLNSVSAQDGAILLQCEDHLYWSPVETSHTAAEAHELVQVGHPLGTSLRSFLRYDQWLASRVCVFCVRR